MNNKRKNLYWLLSICFVLLVLIGGHLGYKVYKYEIKQTETITELEEKVALLQIELKHNDIEWGNGFNYLAIGNSITSHEANDYWWNSGVGMAASDAQHDYVSLVDGWLKEKKGNVCTHKMNSYMWEKQAHDRAESFVEFMPYFSTNVNLVTVQLGENVIDFSTYYEDYVELIRYIQKGCPNAQLIIIGDFWESDGNDIKRKVAADCNVQFADLSSIWADSDYQVGIGAIVYGNDGEEHIVEHNGVAKHPSDKGMQFIADSVESFID